MIAAHIGSDGLSLPAALFHDLPTADEPADDRYRRFDIAPTVPPQVEDHPSGAREAGLEVLVELTCGAIPEIVDTQVENVASETGRLDGRASEASPSNGDLTLDASPTDGKGDL